MKTNRSLIVLMIFTLFCNTIDLNARQEQETTVEIQLPSGFSYLPYSYYEGVKPAESIKYVNDSTLYVLPRGTPQGIIMLSRGSTAENANTILIDGPPLSNPDDFLVHPNGNIYITEAGGRNKSQILYKIPPEGGKLVSFVTGRSIAAPNAFNPYGLAIAPPGFDGPNVDPGDIIVADHGLRRNFQAVWAINPSTGVAKPIAKGEVFQYRPLRVDFNPDGKLVVYQANSTGPNKIILMDAEGEISTLLSNIPSQVVGMLAVNPVSGDVFFGLKSEVLQIWHLPAKGGYPSVFASAMGNNMRALEFSPDGHSLFVGFKKGIIEIKGPFLEPLSGIEYTMGSIGGKVENSKDGVPYPDLTMVAHDGNKIVSSIKTNEKGEFDLMLLPGEYTVKPMEGQGINSSDGRILKVTGGQKMEADFAVNMIELPEILEQSLTQYKSINGYRDTIISEVHMVKSGMDNRMKSELLFAYEKPKRILMKYNSESAIGDIEIFGNGEKMIYHKTTWKQYTEEDQAEELTQNTLQWVESIIAGDFILAEDPLQNMRVGLIEVKEAGNEQLDGISTTLINMKKTTVSIVGMMFGNMPNTELLIPVRLWIGNNDKLIHKMAYDLDMEQFLTNLPDDQRKRMEEYYKGMKITITETHKGIEIDPVFQEDDFTFVPPEGIKLVKNFSPPSRPRPEDSDLMNSPAPGFTLKDLEGQKTRLADLKGKVALIHFWATWCGPCVNAMPHVQGLYKKYADEDVIVLGINSWERDHDKVEPFLKKLDITYKVLLDSDNKVIDEYRVSGIPTFFIIDKKGIIRYAYTGFSQGVEDIQKNIDELLSE